MTRAVVTILREQLEETYAGIHASVEGLTDDEFFWEPLPGCWTVRRRDDGRWTENYAESPHPDPAPFTTVGWRLVHVAECKVMYQEFAFGAAKLTIDSPTPPWPRLRSSTWATRCSRATSTLSRTRSRSRGANELGRNVAREEHLLGDGQPGSHHGGEIRVPHDLYRERLAGA